MKTNVYWYRYKGRARYHEERDIKSAHPHDSTVAMASAPVNAGDQDKVVVEREHDDGTITCSSYRYYKRPAPWSGGRVLPGIDTIKYREIKS